MDISINRLSVKNFKGIKEFTLNLGGQSAVVSGENGTGKTTLKEAFYWIFGDIRGGFNPLVQSDDPALIEKPPAIVEIEIFVSSKLINLRKIFKQKWRKKKGKIESEFCGHTTNYFFNETPMKEKDFQKKLAELFDLKLFRCLTDVFYFCSKLDCNDRRKILLDLIGSIDSQALFDHYPALKPLELLLADRSEADLKSMLSADRRRLDKILSELPVRIDELQKDLLADGDIDRIENDILALDEKINLMKMPDHAESQNLIQLGHLKAALKLCEKSEEHERQFVKNTLENLKFRLNQVDKILEELKQKLKRNIQATEKSALELRMIMKKRRLENTKKYEGGNKCYVCGALLSGDQLVEQIEKFNSEKAETLKALDEKAESIRINSEELATGKNEIKEDIKKFEGHLVKLNADIKELQNAETGNPDKDKIISDIKKLENEMPAKPELEPLLAEKRQLEKLRLDLMAQEKNTAKIESYRSEIKSAAAEYATVEKRLFLLEEYTRIKNEYLESRVNSFFQLTTWRLFETQINNGIKYICEPTSNGIGFNSDLNTGAKINVGLDCISTLAKHYQVKCPVWIDNFESITGLIESDLQIIKLQASKKYKKLQIEGD